MDAEEQRLVRVVEQAKQQFLESKRYGPEARISARLKLMSARRKLAAYYRKKS